MSMMRDMMRRGRQVTGPVIGAVLMVYFGYHLIQGERGLLAWRQLDHQIVEGTARRDGLEATRARLEGRVALLRSENLDPDMLDERVRAMLNLAAEDEVVVLLPRKGLGEGAPHSPGSASPGSQSPVSRNPVSQNPVSGAPAP